MGNCSPWGRFEQRSVFVWFVTAGDWEQQMVLICSFSSRWRHQKYCTTSACSWCASLAKWNTGFRSFLFSSIPICWDDDPSWYIIFDIALWLLSHWRCHVQCLTQQLLCRVRFEKAQELPRRRVATATRAMPCQSLALATMTMLSWPVMSAPVAVIGCNPYVTGTTGLLGEWTRIITSNLTIT